MQLDTFLFQQAKPDIEKVIKETPEYKNEIRKDRYLESQLKLYENKFCHSVEYSNEYSRMISLLNFVFKNIPKEKYTAYCGNVITDNELVKTIGNGYKIVVANIVADVLIGMSDLFSDFLTDDGILIMSGIIVERKNEVIEAVENQGFKVISVAEKDGWAAVSMKK